MKCPICGNQEFKTYNGRANAQCTNCKSLERGRYLWLVLKKMDILKPDIRVLHIAPEYFLLKPLKNLCGDYYHPCDINPGRYTNKIANIYQLDLCHDLEKLPSNCFDLIIHNHVLEHIPCSVEATLQSLIRVMKDGGHQFFTVPFRGDCTKEDLSNNLSDEERTQQFGQSDHLRIFGSKEFPEMLKLVLNRDEFIIKPSDIAQKEEMAEAVIPVDIFNDMIDGNTIFYFQKTSLKL
jgi:SAM-dependent methyltransferase